MSTNSNHIYFELVSDVNNSNFYRYLCDKVFYKWSTTIGSMQSYLRCSEVMYIAERVSSLYEECSAENLFLAVAEAAEAS